MTTADPLRSPSNWPTNGEIDVMEAINNGTRGNMMTLHTTDDCSMGVKRVMSAAPLDTNCYNATDDNAGCGTRAAPASYGPAFNAAGGGVMAVEWRDAGIRIWQFGRGDIPADIAANDPHPADWGMAAADFPSTDCDMATHFRNQSIIVNIDLCGDLIYDTWNTTGCMSSFSPLCRRTDADNLMVQARQTRARTTWRTTRWLSPRRTGSLGLFPSTMPAGELELGCGFSVEISMYQENACLTATKSFTWFHGQ